MISMCYENLRLSSTKFFGKNCVKSGFWDKLFLSWGCLPPERIGKKPAKAL
ncbi:Uncharacterized protein dnm_038620 [Desulfonema magnum]|uniref:Uncharacterized protein n=1 Tax=Desulfonema magnum TaxID=45655 RepID=A0A975GNI9_9BACT|nr:Uncharacterized protein dnm_038620 [Desulfonema magnum]